jgi:hypothetical protein
MIDGLIFSHLLKSTSARGGLSSQATGGSTQRPSPINDELPPSSVLSVILMVIFEHFIQVFLSQGCELTRGLYIEPKKDSLKVRYAI